MIQLQTKGKGKDMYKELVRQIENKKHSIPKLAEKVEKNYVIATALRERLKTLFLEAIKKSGKKYSGLYEMGEIYMEQPYNYRVGMSLKDFRSGIENFIPKDTPLNKFYHENTKGLYNMSVALYRYKAYRKVLMSELDMLDYNYFNIMDA